MNFIMNKSTDYDDETVLSGQGLLTIKMTPDELKSVQEEIKELKESNKINIKQSEKSVAFGLESAMEIKELKEKVKKLQQEREMLPAAFPILVTDTSMEAECKGLREEGLKALEMIKELKELADYYQSGVLERICEIMPQEFVESPVDIIGDVCDYIKELKEEILNLSQSGEAIDSQISGELFQMFDQEVATCDIPDEVGKLMKKNEELMKCNDNLAIVITGLRQTKKK